MRKKLLNNLGLKLISLLLAFLLWFVVVQVGDPKDDRDMGNIQVKLVNTELLEKENKVYEILDNTDTVRVTVYAPKSVFTQLRNSDITAEADVSKLTDINTVPITFTASNANVVSIRGSHDVVRLNVEEKASKYVSLVSKSVGEVAEGYMVYSLTPDQNRIEVSGPKSAVDQVKYAGVEIDVTDATSNLTANVDIKLYDGEGNIVERANLVKNVDYVRMSAEILAVKEVPIELETTGTPAQGYMATGKTQSDPMTVKLAGSAYNLIRTGSIQIPEEELDISGAEEDVIKIVDIREYLPDGVKLAESGFNGKITVTAYIEPIEHKTLLVPIENVHVANVPEGFEAEITESADTLFTLEVSGLNAHIEPLRQESVTGKVDLAAWMQENKMESLKEGSYSIPVTFALSDDVVLKKNVTVKIVIKIKE